MFSPKKLRINLNDNHTWALESGNSDSDRKRMTTVHKLGVRMVVIIYLSPKVLQRSDGAQITMMGMIKSLTATRRPGYPPAANDKFARNGLRVFSCGFHRPLDSEHIGRPVGHAGPGGKYGLSGFELP